MEPAVAPFRDALDEVELREPALPRLLLRDRRSRSPTSAPSSPTRSIRPVRWRETVLALHEAGARRFVEVGPGKVLARLGKRILAGVQGRDPGEELAHA